MLIACAVSRAAVATDVTGDGITDVADVNAVINVILGNNAMSATSCDITGDGIVDVADVNVIITAILASTGSTMRTGYDYVWDYSVMPEIHISVTQQQWNRLLDSYDADRLTKEYISVDVRYVSGSDTSVIADAGLRIRGNGSRRRPEGAAGEHHIAGNTTWHPTGFGLNLRKFHKDDAHTLRGIRKVHLRYFYHDPSYVRELFCYRLLADFGSWVAPRDTYCRLWIHVQGDDTPAYYGVYTMLEPIDEQYLKARSTLFGSHNGYLWKCGQGIATLTSGADRLFGIDNEERAYVLKTHTNRLEHAKAQFLHFMTQLNTLSDDEFAGWLPSVCDVPLLLRSYAVVVAAGSWDDYWNNSNNYYLYFNSTSTDSYQFFFIPYDLDNTLGSSRKVFAITDSGRQDPLRWGMDERNPLIARVLKIEQYRRLYLAYLSDLVNSDNDFMHPDAAMRRIAAWQEIVAPYVSSDVDRDNVLADLPSKLGNMPQYRLLDDDPQCNFFRVRAAVIDSVISKTLKTPTTY